MAVKLALDSPNGNKETRILLVINHLDTKIRFPTGEKVTPTDWNKEKGEVRKGNPECIAINQRIFAQLAAVKMAVNSLLREKQPITREAIQQATNGLLEGKRGLSMCEYLDKVILQMKTGERVTGRGQPYQRRTIQDYEVLKSLWSKFNNTIAINRIDTLTVQRFLAGFGDISKNYRTKLATQTKTVLKWAKADKLTTLDIAISATMELTEQVVLSESELNSIAALQLKGILKATRDLFLIGSYTGLRISDVNRLKPDNFKNEDGQIYLSITTKKTTQKIIIPVKPLVVEILNEYKYQLPIVNIVPFNIHIKQVCRLAGIISDTKTGITIGNQRRENVLQKWEVVSSHTMRRSFATNLYLSGVDTTTIRKLTGHKTESSFFRYIRVSSDDNAKKASQLAFFQ